MFFTLILYDGSVIMYVYKTFIWKLENQSSFKVHV